MNGAERNSLPSNRRKLILRVGGGKNQEVQVQLEAEAQLQIKLFHPQTEGPNDPDLGLDLVVEDPLHQEKDLGANTLEKDQGLGHGPAVEPDLGLGQSPEEDRGADLVNMTCPVTSPRDLPLLREELDSNIKLIIVVIIKNKPLTTLSFSSFYVGLPLSAF